MVFSYKPHIPMLTIGIKDQMHVNTSDPNTTVAAQMYPQKYDTYNVAVHMVKPNTSQVTFVLATEEDMDNFWIFMNSLNEDGKLEMYYPTKTKKNA